MRDVVVLRRGGRWRECEGEVERLDDRQERFLSPFQYLQTAIDGFRLQLKHHKLLAFGVYLRQWYAISLFLGLLAIGKKVDAYGS
jgi:hypothetical protein